MAAQSHISILVPFPFELANSSGRFIPIRNEQMGQSYITYIDGSVSLSVQHLPW